MAVEDKYVDSSVEAGGVGGAYAVQGGAVIAMVKTFEVAAADDDGSKYRVFPNVNAHLIPIDIKVANDAITGGTDYDLGLYEVNSGPVIGKDVLADGMDLSSAHINGAELSGISAVNVADAEKALYELAGDSIGSIKEGGYDIVLTANTVGTAAGTVTVRAMFLQKF